MIDVVTGLEIQRRQAEVQEMFRQRHKVFKERLKWQVPSVDGLEFDEYDHPETLYLLCHDDAGRQIGSARILPTTGPYSSKTCSRSCSTARRHLRAPSYGKARVWPSTSHKIQHRMKDVSPWLL